MAVRLPPTIIVCDMRTSGFAILEVVVAAVILSVGILAAASASAAAIRAAGAAHRDVGRALLGSWHAGRAAAGRCGGQAPPVGGGIPGFRIHVEAHREGAVGRAWAVVDTPGGAAGRSDTFGIALWCP